jgi:hypothetical protein
MAALFLVRTWSSLRDLQSASNVQTHAAVTRRQLPGQRGSGAPIASNELNRALGLSCYPQRLQNGGVLSGDHDLLIRMGPKRFNPSNFAFNSGLAHHSIWARRRYANLPPIHRVQTRRCFRQENAARAFPSAMSLWPPQRPPFRGMRIAGDNFTGWNILNARPRLSFIPTTFHWSAITRHAVKSLAPDQSQFRLPFQNGIG